MIIDKLKEILHSDQIKTGDELSDEFHHIWKMDEGLDVLALVMPKSTIELSQIMKLCHSLNQTVVIHGGRTNLVGGTEVRSEQVVISMRKMNMILEVDSQSRTITCEAGVILEQVHNAVDQHDLMFPLNFGAKGSAQIGGIISSNAGGLRVFRYGMTRQLVLGLEAVMADGTVVSSMKKIIKDNSGYDLKQLFVGSEGTLGIITKAVLRLVEKPKSRCSVMAAFNSYENVVSFLKYMDKGLAGTMSGFELMWDNYYEMVTSKPSEVKPPLPHGFKYYVLVESLGSDQTLDSERMESLCAQAFEENILLDAVLAQSESDLDWFWRIREDVHAAVSQLDNDQHFDISLPIPFIGKTLDDILTKLHEVPEVINVVSFGHVADGNIHLVVGKSVQNQDVIAKVNDIIYGPLKALGGSVSAEHGIGLHKKAYLHLCRNDEEIQMMKLLKKSLDPKCLLNPMRIID